jgi:hypothetical protein
MSEEGCSKDLKASSKANKKIVCVCNHLTNFATG